MIIIKRVNSDDKDFQELVKQLNEGLLIRDGVEQNFYLQFNKIDMIKHSVIAYENNEPVGCGAIKEYSIESMEVKRMFVQIPKRGKGISKMILADLENWAKELEYKKCVLETGKKNSEAISLYLKSGYKIISNYGQYVNVANSICFEKDF
ncbi:MAG: GNAT family N-acetyltransferase [Bacteroidia bacterium]